MNNNNTQNNTQNSSQNSSQNSKNGNQSSSLNGVVNWKKYVLRKLLVCIPLCLLILLMYHVSEKGRKYNGNAPLFGQRCIFGIMSTVASIQLYGPDRKTFQEGFEEVQTSFQSVEKLCNIFQAGSELSRLNATAFEKPFPCSDPLWELLCEARKYYEISEGAFDVTITPLMQLWGFHRKRGSLPTEAEIADALSRTGLDKVIFDDNAHTVRFRVEGMSIDLGGIAKGWALDKAADGLKKQGFASGFLDLGGNVLCLDAPPPGRNAYRVGIRDPFRKDRSFASAELLSEAVATSGNYERYVVIDGRHCTHIMNPKTGKPVENMISVSVIAPDGVSTDALSTAVFVNGIPFAERMMKRFPQLRILILSRDPEQPEKLLLKTFGPGWRIDRMPEVPEGPEGNAESGTSARQSGEASEIPPCQRTRTDDPQRESFLNCFLPEKKLRVGAQNEKKMPGIS